jgi:hypothetical protein
MPHVYFDSYPYLDSLIGGWFHQDLDLEGDTLEEILENYKKGSPPDDWPGVRADILRLIRNSGENLDSEFIRLLQPSVDPAGWGMTTRDWLMRIHALL